MAENMNEPMEMEADILTLVDDEGVEHSFELLDVLEEGERKFLAMIPYFESAEESMEDSGELIIFEAIMEEDEEVLATIEDDDLFDRISAVFMERLADLYEFEEE